MFSPLKGMNWENKFYRMKIVLAGASGIIGGHLDRSWQNEHEIIRASTNKSEYTLDFTSLESIREFLKQIHSFDALVITAGSAPLKPIAELTAADFYEGFKSKLMGQINLVLEAQQHLSKNGVITLTSGILSEDPIPNGTALSTVNAALNGFVKAASQELILKGKRLNVVSPGLLQDSAERLQGFFPGHHPVSAAKVVKAYEKSVFGQCNGEVIKVYQ